MPLDGASFRLMTASVRQQYCAQIWVGSTPVRAMGHNVLLRLVDWTRTRIRIPPEKEMFNLYR